MKAVQQSLTNQLTYQKGNSKLMILLVLCIAIVLFFTVKVKSKGKMIKGLICSKLFRKLVSLSPGS